MKKYVYMSQGTFNQKFPTNGAVVLEYDSSKKEFTVIDLINNLKVTPSGNGGISQAVLNAKLADYATKAQVQNVSNKISGFFKIQGSCSLAELSSKEQVEGYIWQVDDKEYVWNGTNWVQLGFEVSLENYYTKEEIDQKGFLTEHQPLSGKVDKIEGKSLIADTEILRLATLNNYDDAELRTAISGKADKTQIPLSTSQLFNDSNFLTEHQSLSGKVDKIQGKSLISDTEIARLSSIVNYDDAELRTAISGKQNIIDAEHKLSATFIEGLPTDNASISYVDQKVADLINSAPEALDTIKELSDALSGDANFATTVMTQIGKKVDKVQGKSLIADTEISRLAVVDNYDDAELRTAISGKADKTQIPLSTSQLFNDSGFLTEHQSLSSYYTKEEIDSSISGKADKTQIPLSTSQLFNDSGFLTEHQSLTGFVQKVEGKGLSTNDYTDEEKAKLSGLENYDDTALIQSITTAKQEAIASANETALQIDGSNALNKVLVISEKTTEPAGPKDTQKHKMTVEANPINYGIFSFNYTDSQNNTYSTSLSLGSTADQIIVKSVADSTYATKTTTLSGYGITDAKIENGTITLGSDSITPLIEHQSLTGFVQKVEGKSLIDDTEIARLSSVVNYDDDELRTIISGKADKTQIPTKTSELTNDAGFLTEHQDISKISENSADITALATRLNIVEDKVDALKKTNTEVIAATSGSTLTVNDSTADFILGGQTDQALNAKAKTIQMKNFDVALPSGTTLASDNALLLDVTDDVEVKNSTIQMNQSSSSNCIKVVNADSLIIRDTTFTGTTYNTIMTGQSCTSGFLKNVLIDNCNFNEDCKHVNIWFAGYDDDAVLTISNCHFNSCEQILCVGDFANANNKLTINIINCTIDNYDDSYINGYGYEYAGIILFDARNNGNHQSFISANPFGNGKVVLNINNLIVKGTKMTTDTFKVGTKQQGQMLYLYRTTKVDNVTDDECIEYSDETKYLFPTINIQ